MAQTKAGARLAAVRRMGMTLDEYEAMVTSGLRWCTRCKAVHPADEFGSDVSRPDGLAAACRASRKAHYQRTYQPKIGPRRYGPPPKPPRDEDRKQARQRINVEVRTGRRPRPNALPCADCGHVWADGERRHEYDHYLGYAAEHHYDVEPVCTVCHRKRAVQRGEMRPRGKGKRGRFVASAGGGADG